MNAAPESLAGATPARGPGVLAAHLLAYGDLLTALLHAWQRSLGQRMVGAVLAVLGLSTGLMLLTVGVIVAAWPTQYRWLVLLGVVGLYLIAGAVGVWLLVRRPPAPAPASILFNELRKDAQLLSDVLKERRNEQ